jgi:hypothetical protein
MVVVSFVLLLPDFVILSTTRTVKAKVSLLVSSPVVM